MYYDKFSLLKDNCLVLAKSHIAITHPVHQNLERMFRKVDFKECKCGNFYSSFCFDLTMFCNLFTSLLYI